MKRVQEEFLLFVSALKKRRGLKRSFRLVSPYNLDLAVTLYSGIRPSRHPVRNLRKSFHNMRKMGEKNGGEKAKDVEQQHLC